MHRISGMDTNSSEDGTVTLQGLPPLPFNLNEYKVRIALYWTLMVVTSGILPAVGYFALQYGTSLGRDVNFSIWLSITAVVSLYSLIRRSWMLVRRGANCKPIGASSAWAFDFFNWNFILGFIALAAMISVGSSIISWPLVSLPIAVVLLYVCSELVLIQLFMALDLRLPFPLSSTAAGAKLRPGSSIIVEDIIAVDGDGGQAFRKAWGDRYECSAPMRRLLVQVDLLWGVTGLAITAIIFGLVFGLENKEVGYAVGWLLPWAWAGPMTYWTFRMAKIMHRREAAKSSNSSG